MWSAVTLVTTSTSHQSHASPLRTIPPRAVSKTATAAPGSVSTALADSGPVQSPRTTSRPAIVMPLVVVYPTRQPHSDMTWAIILTVVVLPLVPVTATSGMRDGSSRAKRLSTIAPPADLGSPTDGCSCIRIPGAAFTSITVAPDSASGAHTVLATTSMP